MAVGLAPPRCRGELGRGVGELGTTMLPFLRAGNCLGMLRVEGELGAAEGAPGVEGGVDGMAGAFGGRTALPGAGTCAGASNAIKRLSARTAGA